MTARSMSLALAALASLAILVVACGGGAATAAPGSSQGAATPAPATQGPASSDGAEFSFDLSSFHADAQLEELFPDQIGGEDLSVLSMSGDEFMGEGTSPELDAALSALNKQASDLSVAFGGATSVTIIAFQLDGVPGGTILNAIFQAYQQETGSTITDVNISGKSVKKIVPADPEEPTSYIYTAQDVVFSVGGLGDLSDATLNEVFSKLP
jgi:hypothetical protein